MMKRLFILLAVIVCFSLPCQATGSGKSKEVGDDQLKEVKISRGERILAVVRVEVVDSPQDRARGLMFRRSLAPDRGMWFVFDRDVLSPFWMENTYISLDIIFISRENKIISIARGAKSLSRDKIYPESLYRYVLEVNAGFADKHKLRRGDEVSLR